MKVVRASVRKITAPGNIDTNSIGNVLDIAFKNTGKVSCLVLLNGSDPFTLAVGDPMFSLGGYDNSRRDDIVSIEFEAGADPELTLLFTKSVC
jgi:hypothetical protein